MHRKATLAALIAVSSVVVICVTAFWPTDSELFLRRRGGLFRGRLLRRPVLRPVQNRNWYPTQAQNQRLPASPQRVVSNRTVRGLSNNLTLFVRELDKQDHGLSWKKFLQTSDLARISKTKIEDLSSEDHETLQTLNRRFKMVQQKTEYATVMRLHGFMGTANELEQKLTLVDRHANVVASAKVKNAKPKKNAKPNFLQSPVIANAFKAQPVAEPEKAQVQQATPATPEPKPETLPPKQNDDGFDELDFIANKPNPAEQQSQPKDTAAEKKLVDVKLSLKPKSATKPEKTPVATKVTKETPLNLDLQPLETLEALPEAVPQGVRVPFDRKLVDPKQDKVDKEPNDVTAQNEQEKFRPILEAETPLPNLDQLPAPVELPERIAAPIAEEPNEDVTRSRSRQEWQDHFSSVYSYLVRR